MDYAERCKRIDKLNQELDDMHNHFGVESELKMRQLKELIKGGKDELRAIVKDLQERVRRLEGNGS